MARLQYHTIPAVLLLAILAAAAATAATADGSDEGKIKISVQYPTKEESQWLDRWAAKHRAQKPGSDFSIQPATEEESAYLNSIFSDGGAGFDGHIEFDGDRPRMVVETVHSRASSSKPKDDDVHSQESSSSHAKYDVKDL